MMKKKRSIGIILYSLLGLIIGLYGFYGAFKYGLSWRDGTAAAGNWVTGFAFILFSLGVFTLINWVRIVIVVISSIVSSLFIAAASLLFLLRPDNWAWGIIGISVFFPVFLLSIYSWIYFTRPKVKEQFK